MVTEALVSAVVAVWSWFMTSITAPSPPAWFGEAADGIGEISVMLGTVSVWIPVGLLSLVLGTWVVMWTLGVSVKVGRMVLSLLTLGGGAA